VKWLVANRAPFDIEDDLGRTPLMVAEDFGNNEVAKFLKVCEDEAADPQSGFSQMRTANRPALVFLSLMIFSVPLPSPPKSHTVNFNTVIYNQVAVIYLASYHFIINKIHLYFVEEKVFFLLCHY